ncbi:MAG TPA: hypothetical protein EYG49_01955, partial [Gammaproteobacteria bacterium]|nr:hypothetical protein [Gammaproteobacteria bacterium]
MVNKPIKIKWIEVPSFLLALSLLFFSDLVIAGPLGLPDSARPGAVRPQSEIPLQQEPVTPAADIVEIPAVIDRPFELEEGPYVAVKEFRLDAEDLPKYDVNIDEIKSTILDKLLQGQPERG